MMRTKNHWELKAKNSTPACVITCKNLDAADELVKREKRIGQVERHLIENSADSELAFDRLVTGNPNSSEIWIKYVLYNFRLRETKLTILAPRYMAYFLHEKNYVKAKSIAERALSVINYRLEKRSQVLRMSIL